MASILGFIRSCNRQIKSTRRRKIQLCKNISEAANAIFGLSLTNDNYGEAINILKDRFGNKQIIPSKKLHNIINHF